MNLDKQLSQLQPAADRYSSTKPATGSQSSSPSTYSNFGLQPAIAKERATTTKPPAANDDLFSAPTPTDKPPLRYDGKTFDEWMQLWQNELRFESRAKAIPALLAFATHGEPQRVADAMLAVAGHLHWRAFRDTNGYATPEGQFCAGLMFALTGQSAEPSHVPMQATLPLVVEAARSNDPELVAFADCFFSSLGNVSPDPDVIAPLVELSRDVRFANLGHSAGGIPITRDKILESLTKARGTVPHAVIDDRLREAIDDGTQPEQLLALESLYPLPERDPEEMMGASNAEALHYGAGTGSESDNIEQRHEWLVDVDVLLKGDKTQMRKHGMQILRLVRPPAVDQVPEVAKLLLADDNQERVLAARVLRELTGSNDAAIEYLRSQVGPKNSGELNARRAEMLKTLEASSTSP